MRINHQASLPVALALVLVSSMAATVSSHAAGSLWGPREFCTLGGKDTGTDLPNCYYYTWEQCIATARGNDQSCMVNPYYTGATTNGKGTVRKHRTHAKQ
jgi:hypothetical protein